MFLTLLGRVIPRDPAKIRMNYVEKKHEVASDWGCQAQFINLYLH